MVSFLFRPRFKNDSWKMIPLSSSARGVDFLLKNNTSILFRLRFWLLVKKWYFYPLPPEVLTSCWKMILLSSSAWGFDFLLKNNTFILFRSGFETDLYLLILLSSFARGSKLIFIYWYFYPLSHEVRSWSLNNDSLTWLDLHWIAKLSSVPVLHLQAGQTWFCSSLTLGSQSNL